MGEVRYVISEVVNQTNLKPHTIRYWEDELGLKIVRDAMGHRCYSENDIKLFLEIKELKDKGFQLKAIKTALAGIGELNQVDAEAIEQLKRHIKEINEFQEYETGYGESNQISNITQQQLPNSLLHTEGKERYIDSIEKKADSRGQDVINYTQSKLEKKQLEPVNNGKPEIGLETNIVAGGEKVARNEIVTSHDDMDKNDVVESSNNKMEQFRDILHTIVLDAMKDNAVDMTEQITNNVTDNVIKEMDYLFRIKEEREEERFKKLDETIRDVQKSRQEVAVTTSKRKKKRFFRK